MDNRQVIQVQSEFSVIRARAKVRRLAQSQGLSIQDQARISLATSSLANRLGVGAAHRGQIIVDCLKDVTDRVGIRVCCIKTLGALDGLIEEAFHNIRWMIDELDVESLPSNDLKVTIIKWQS